MKKYILTEEELSTLIDEANKDFFNNDNENQVYHELEDYKELLK